MIKRERSPSKARVYKVLIAPGGQRDLDDIPPHDRQRIEHKILSLAHTPRPIGVKKLEEHLHRVRVGDWRILYDIYDKNHEVLVLRVLRRSERTYKNI